MSGGRVAMSEKPCGSGTGCHWKDASPKPAYQQAEARSYRCNECCHVAPEATGARKHWLPFVADGCQPGGYGKCLGPSGYAFAAAAGITLTTCPGGEE